MTVEIKTPQAKNGSCLEGAAPKAVDLRDILDVDPLQQGQALLAASKKRKKQQKRAGISLNLVLVAVCCGVILWVYVAVVLRFAKS